MLGIFMIRIEYKIRPFHAQGPIAVDGLCSSRYRRIVYTATLYFDQLFRAVDTDKTGDRFILKLSSHFTDKTLMSVSSTEVVFMRIAGKDLYS